MVFYGGQMTEEKYYFENEREFVEPEKEEELKERKIIK